ncbi:MAG: DUF1801 domain-containing protein [Cytophagaceae bacterium]
MPSIVKTPEDYLKQVSKDRLESFGKLRVTILKNIPKGFEECIAYGMISYVIPHSLYPDGYHCNPKIPLPFISIASQKNFIALHHLGLYGSPKLLDWFVKEYAAKCEFKLDMGKGCVRFKKPEHIPYKLIADLIKKVSAKEWIELYEKNFKKKK